MSANGPQDLRSDRTYYVQVIARDIYGTTYTSAVKTGTTTFNSYVDPMIPVDQSRTGMTVDYMPEETAGWAIWGEDDHYLYLISRDAKKVTLTGKAEGTTDEYYLNVLDLATQAYASKIYARSNGEVNS